MSAGVYPVGLINKNSIRVDSVKINSHDFFEHDIGHSNMISNTPYLIYSEGNRLLHKRLLDIIEGLPPNKRKTAEGVVLLL